MRVLHAVLIFIVLSCWTFEQTKCEAVKDSAENTKSNSAVKSENGDDANSGQVDEAGEVPKNRTSVVAGVQRRLSIVGAPRRDTQLLSLLAARRRQLLTERLGAHLATIATFASKPDRHNITNAHLEIRDSNNTVIKRISLPDNKSLSTGEIRLDRESKTPYRIEPIAKLTTQSPDPRSSEVKSSLNAKAIQDAKAIRAGFLNNRRKPASEVIRYGTATRKPLFDISVVSHETLGIPEHKDSDDKTDVLLDPEEEFQVDESNHGIILYNYSNNDTTVYKSNETNPTPKSDIEIINATLTTRSSFPDEPTKITKEVKLHAKINLNILNSTVNNNTSLDSNDTINDQIQETTIKTIKTETVPSKDNENNTLFLTDELYNHFRPLESELPVEDMAPFLFFGQKITLSIPRDNITHLQLTPTKPTHYIRQHDKNQRGSYRPAKEKITNTSEENEDEVNENMDVSVVRNVIEKNKIRNTAKLQSPSRHGNLVNAYRKLQILNSTTPVPILQIMPNNQTLIEIIDESKEKRVVEPFNRTVATNYTRSINRTFNYRRKPAKLIQLINETAERETTTTSATTTPTPSTVVYTAVVTSVSVTSSVKALNKTDAKNSTSISPPDDIAIKLNDTAKSLKNTTSAEESANGILETASNATIDSISDDKKKNNTIINKFKKKPDSRHRLSTIRPRIRFTTHVKSNFENSNPASPTPFILYSNRSIPRILSTTSKYKYSTTTERINTTTQKVQSSTQYYYAKDKSLNLSTNAIINTTEDTKIIIPSTTSTTTTTKRYKLSELSSDTNIFKINNLTSRSGIVFNNSDKNNSYFYLNDTTSTTTVASIKINEQESSTVRSRKKNNDSNEYDKKLSKEILERRNNEVLIEMEKTNLTTYVLAGLGFLPLTIIVMFVLRHIFLKKTKDIDTDYEGYFQDPEMKKESQITTVARPPLPPPNKPDQKWEFPRNKLRLQTLLGQGNFGQVWKAEADDLTGHDGLTRLVAVKTIKETATQKEKQELLQEIYIMQKIGNHPNVVTLLACCTEQEPYLLIMEYVMCGKLLTYLRDRRSRVDRFQMPRGGLTSRDLTVFAYCVARGMDYLASKGIIHRDLAARNVLVDHNKLCKIADFGMSREVTSTTDDKASKPQRNALPVRWMAPEALLYSVYSHESDVWAYGVLLWEIVTLGSTPYATMSGREVLHMVTEGYRLERPAHCKPHLYDTMHSCWHADPAQRPPFSEIKKQLSELLENEPTEGNYVDLESFYQDSSVYSDPSAIIENDGGISIEYSDELGSKLREEEPRRSFHIPNANNLQRNRSNYRNENFNTVRAGNHTSVGGFGIMDGGFSGRDGNFCERGMEKLSGSSFHRERENNISRENGHPGNSLISRNSFNGVGNQNNWSGHSGRPFITKSGSSRSKRISEFECNI